MSLCPYFMVVKSQLRYEEKNGSCLVQFVFLFLFSVCVCALTLPLNVKCVQCLLVDFLHLFVLDAFLRTWRYGR